MTIKDIKTFLEQFDENEVVVDIEYEYWLDICEGCDNYKIDDYRNCVYSRQCSDKEHEDIENLRIIFESDAAEDGKFYSCGYHVLETINKS